MTYSNAASPRICCAHGMSVGDYSDCYKETVDAKELETRVLFFLRQQVKTIMELTEQIKVCRENNAGIFDHTRKSLMESISHIDEGRIWLYEKYAGGHISRDKYLAEKEQLNAESERLHNELAELENEREKEDSFLFEADRIAGRCGKLTNRSRLTKEIADAYIEKVIFHDEFDLEIEFIFEDVIKERMAAQA